MASKITAEQSNHDEVVWDCIREILDLPPMYFPEKKSPLFFDTRSSEEIFVQDNFNIDM